MKNGCTMHYKSINIAISAFFLAVSYNVPATWGWLIFLFLVPLFYCSVKLNTTLEWYDGIWWGYCFYGVHFIELLFLLMQRTSLVKASICWSLLISYCALYSGMWFWGTSWIIKWKKLFHVSLRRPFCYVTWIVTTYSYFFVVRWYIFLPFGIGGYCFGLPLLPLIYYPSWLYLLPCMGSSLLLLQIIISSVYITQFLITFRIKWAGIAFFFLISFMYGWLIEEENNEKEGAYYHVIGYIQPLERTTGFVMDDAQKINNKIDRFLDKNPEKVIIIMPESTLQYSLNDIPEILTLWQKNVLSREIILCLCAHRTEGGKLYNTFYAVDKLGIIKNYDKILLVPFTEYIPTLFKENSWLKNIFFKNQKEFTPNKISPAPFTCAQVSLIPYICSEFFFGTIKNIPNTIPVCLINDSWFSTTYFKNLMRMFAQYTAMETKQDIIYVGHYNGLLIKKNGTYKNINVI